MPVAAPRRSRESKHGQQIKVAEAQVARAADIDPSRWANTPFGDDLLTARWDIEFFAERFLGFKPHEGQKRLWRAIILRDETGWEPRYLDINCAAGNRAGKTDGIVIPAFHAAFYKHGLKPPNPLNERAVEKWTKAPWEWYHFAVAQEIAELAYIELTRLLSGTHEAQKNGCPLTTELGPQVVDWSRKYRGEYLWMTIHHQFGGAEMHFRTTGEKAIGSLGKDMSLITYDEAGFDPNMEFVINEVLHLRRLSTGGQIWVIGTSTEGLCVEASTPILTADLRWVPAGSLEEGDALWAFDEASDGSRTRGWVESRVVGNFVSRVPLLRVTLESGRSLLATPNHRWLIRSGAATAPGGRMSKPRGRNVSEPMEHGGSLWRRTDQIEPGDYLLRYVEPWAEDASDTWLAGMFDGEGYVTATPDGVRVGIAQNPGPTLDRIKTELDRRGFAYRADQHHGEGPHGPYRSIDITIKGGQAEVLRLLGTLRPTRLLPKARLPGTLQRMKGERGLDRVVSVSAAGEGAIANLTTTSATYFADGYGAHNTTFADRWEEGNPEAPDRKVDSFSMRMSTRDNIGFGITQKQFDRLVAGMDPALIPQNIDGHFIQGRQSFFSAAMVDEMFDNALPDVVAPVKGHTYIQGVDPALTYDRTWSIVLDGTAVPAVGVRAERRLGRVTGPEVAAVAQIAHNAYHRPGSFDCTTGIDATGFGGKMFRDLLSIQPLRSIEFGGTRAKKLKLLMDLKQAIEKKELRFPRLGPWLELRRQLLGYKLADKGLDTDAVMALAIAVSIWHKRPAGSQQMVPFDYFQTGTGGVPSAVSGPRPRLSGSASSRVMADFLNNRGS